MSAVGVVSAVGAVGAADAAGLVGDALPGVGDAFPAGDAGEAVVLCLEQRGHSADRIRGYGR